MCENLFSRGCLNDFRKWFIKSTKIQRENLNRCSSIDRHDWRPYDFEHIKLVAKYPFFSHFSVSRMWSTRRRLWRRRQKEHSLIRCFVLFSLNLMTQSKHSLLAICSNSFGSERKRTLVRVACDDNHMWSTSRCCCLFILFCFLKRIFCTENFHSINWMHGKKKTKYLIFISNDNDERNDRNKTRHIIKIKMSKQAWKLIKRNFLGFSPSHRQLLFCPPFWFVPLQPINNENYFPCYFAWQQRCDVTISSVSQQKKTYEFTNYFLNLFCFFSTRSWLKSMRML